MSEDEPVLKKPSYPFPLLLGVPSDFSKLTSIKTMLNSRINSILPKPTIKQSYVSQHDLKTLQHQVLTHELKNQRRFQKVLETAFNTLVIFNLVIDKWLASADSQFGVQSSPQIFLLGIF